MSSIEHPSERASVAPGRPVRGSDSGRAVMALLDLLGRRWTLRLIWELREQRLTFRALQERCEGMSSSVLNQRLRELRAADIVELGSGGYGLSREGRRLLDAYAPLDAWAKRWAARARARERQPVQPPEQTR
jgi:DNA-binding HxlR family transcriptional regulator